MSQEIHAEEEKVAQGLDEENHAEEEKVAQGLDEENHAEEEKVAEGLDEGAWMNCMRQRILVAGSHGPFHEEHLIYRVNSLMRKGNESCYEPITTSIGPYHHGKEHLLDMETHKRRYVCHLLSRNENIRFEDLVKMMKDREQRVRACYLGKIELKSNAFVEMMLLDGCFIVELFLKIEHEYNGDDLADGPNWRLWVLFCHDLLLLENQLPFFLLQKLFEVVKLEETNPMAFLKLSLKFLKHIGLTKTLKGEIPPRAPEYVHHLLHLLHMQFSSIPKQLEDANLAKQPQDSNIHKLMHLIRIPVKQLQDSKILKCNNLGVTCLGMFNCCNVTTNEQEETEWMPGVTQLEEAGVKFKASSSDLLDINFSKGELIIPTITVSDETEAQLRNLVAFEQCCLVSPQDYYFSSYVIFMDRLINTSKDVEILHKKGILRQWLGEDEEVARLFNKINKGLVINMSQGYLGDTIKRINHYSTRKIHKWRASLARDYFYNPWAVLSLIAAIVALTLTAISAMYSIKSFNNDLHQPKKL